MQPIPTVFFNKTWRFRSRRDRCLDRTISIREGFFLHVIWFRWRSGAEWLRSRTLFVCGSFLTQQLLMWRSCLIHSTSKLYQNCALPTFSQSVKLLFNCFILKLRRLTRHWTNEPLLLCSFIADFILRMTRYGHLICHLNCVKRQNSTWCNSLWFNMFHFVCEVDASSPLRPYHYDLNNTQEAGMLSNFARACSK